MFRGGVERFASIHNAIVGCEHSLGCEHWHKEVEEAPHARLHDSDRQIVSDLRNHDTPLTCTAKCAKARFSLKALLVDSDGTVQVFTTLHVLRCTLTFGR